MAFGAETQFGQTLWVYKRPQVPYNDALCYVLDMSEISDYYENGMYVMQRRTLENLIAAMNAATYREKK